MYILDSRRVFCEGAAHEHGYSCVEIAVSINPTVTRSKDIRVSHLLINAYPDTQTRHLQSRENIASSIERFSTSRHIDTPQNLNFTL